MKQKIIIGVTIVYYGYGLATTKSHSPAAKASYLNNGLNITINYYQPFKKGRVIFGKASEKALQPYGKYWRVGANEATKCFRVIRNLEKILAIELLNASQALEFRRPLKTSPYLETFIADFRKLVPYIHEDRAFYIDIENLVHFLRTTNVIKDAQKKPPIAERLFAVINSQTTVHFTLT